MQCKSLHELLNGADNSPLAKRIITPVVQDFISRLTVEADSAFPHSDFQFRLALWQRNNHNYLAAYASLTEAIVTRYLEKYNEDNIFNYSKREDVKQNLDGRYTLYWDVAKIRNSLVHCTDNVSGTPKELIEKLGKYINRYKHLDD